MPSLIASLLPFLLLLLFACTGPLAPETPDRAGRAGSARLEISLGQAPRALAKKNDTLLTPDTLLLTLAAEGAPARSLKLPVAAGQTTLDVVIPDLAALRNWKLTARTRDDADSTLHLDSTEFYVAPGDTAVVGLSLLPRYAVFVARFVSTDHGISGLEGLRVLVDGRVVDDTVFAKKEKTFDLKLSHKYFPTGKNAAVVLEALDKASPPRVRYSAAFTCSAQPAQDTVFTVLMK